MIPKVIHYCWFGGNPLPQLAVRCLESWAEVCPDYEIKRWDESNFDVNCCDYVREAYEARKWAFVSDYARLWIVYREGGIYLDTDVELVSSLNKFLTDCFFFAIEKDESFFGTEWALVATGLGFGAEASCPVVKKMLDEYDGLHFRMSDGTYDMIPCPVRNSQALLSYGYVEENCIQRFEGGVVYPADYFCPEEPSGLETFYSENTVSIHHYSMTWTSERKRQSHRIKLWMKRRISLLRLVRRIIISIVGKRKRKLLKEL